MIEDEEENNYYETKDENNDECESEEEYDIIDTAGNINSDENDSSEQVVEHENEEQSIKDLEIVEENQNE